MNMFSSLIAGSNIILPTCRKQGEKVISPLALGNRDSRSLLRYVISNCSTSQINAAIINHQRSLSLYRKKTITGKQNRTPTDHGSANTKGYICNTASTSITQRASQKMGQKEGCDDFLVGNLTTTGINESLNRRYTYEKYCFLIK